VGWSPAAFEDPARRQTSQQLGRITVAHAPLHDRDQRVVVDAHRASARHFGFAPIVAFVDRGEPLGLLLRPGSAAANTIADNADVREQALLWLPVE
jgi:hypothetical protein